MSGRSLPSRHRRNTLPCLGRAANSLRCERGVRHVLCKGSEQSPLRGCPGRVEAARHRIYVSSSRSDTRRAGGWSPAAGLSCAEERSKERREY